MVMLIEQKMWGCKPQEHQTWVHEDMRMRMVVLAMRCKLLQRVEIVTGKGMPVNEGQVG